MIQVPHENDDGLMMDENLTTEVTSEAASEGMTGASGNFAQESSTQQEHVLGGTQDGSQTSDAGTAPVIKAIERRHTDLPTSACPLLCALRILRFVSWTLQDRSGAIDYQLLCAVAHDAVQCDALLKKAILHLYTEISEEVAAAILKGNPIPYLACVEIYHKLADRLPAQSYINTVVEITSSCANCGYKNVLLENARELVAKCLH
jgi:hypothetical protein